MMVLVGVGTFLFIRFECFHKNMLLDSGNTLIRCDGNEERVDRGSDNSFSS